MYLSSQHENIHLQGSYFSFDLKFPRFGFWPCTAPDSRVLDIETEIYKYSPLESIKAMMCPISQMGLEQGCIFKDLNYREKGLSI